MKKILVILILAFVICASSFAALFSGNWSPILGELDVQFSKPFALFVEGGVAYKGFTFIPKNTTRIELQVGFPVRARHDYNLNNGLGSTGASSNSTEVGIKAGIRQGFFQDFVTSYLGVDMRAEKLYSTGKGKFVPSIEFATRLNGQIDEKTYLLGWTLGTDMSASPSNHFNISVDGTAGFTPIEVKSSSGANLFSMVVKDRVLYQFSKVWNEDSYSSVYNLKIQKKFRGITRGTYFRNGSIVVNQLDLRFAGPEFWISKKLDSCFPRINLFIDLGGVFNPMTPSNYSGNVPKKFICTAGFQAGLNFFGSIDLMYQGSFIVSGDSFKYSNGKAKRYISSLAFGLTF